MDADGPIELLKFTAFSCKFEPSKFQIVEYENSNKAPL